MKILRVVPLLAALTFTACGDDDGGPEPRNLSGIWTGTAGDVSLELYILDSSSPGIDLWGTLTVAGDAQTIEDSQGWHNPPNLGATLKRRGLPSVELAGRVDGSVIHATLDGGGFDRFAIDLE